MQLHTPYTYTYTSKKEKPEKKNKTTHRLELCEITERTLDGSLLNAPSEQVLLHVVHGILALEVVGHADTPTSTHHIHKNEDR